MSDDMRVGPGAAAGAAGLVMVVAIIVLGPVLGGPDAFSGQAVADYGKDLAGSHFLSLAPARFGCYALLTAVELIFLSGLWAFARQLAPRTMVAPVVALSAAAFVAGGMASDALSLGQLIALHADNGVRPDANLAVISDVASTVLLIEVNVCLGVAIAAVCLAALRSRAVPAPLGWFGLIAAAASAVPGFAPTTEAVFIGSNLLRLAFVAAISVLFLHRAVRSSSDSGSESVPESGTARVFRAASPPRV